MSARDFHNIFTPALGYAPVAFTTDTATNAGAIIDTKGFEGIEFIIQVGVTSAGTCTPLLQDGDDSGLSDVATIAAAYQLGTTANATFTGTTDSNEVKKIGAVNHKRYVRLNLVNAGFTGVIGATALQTYPRSIPTAD